MIKTILAAILFLNSIAISSSIAGTTSSLDEVAQICRGEFAVSNILDAVKRCSEEDLAKATVALYDLQRQMNSVSEQIAKIETYQQSPLYAKEKRTLTTINIAGGAALLLGASGFIVDLSYLLLRNKEFIGKKTQAAFFISMAIGMLALGFPEGGVDPWGIMTYNVSDLPRLKAEVMKFQKEIQNRRALLEAANKIKAGQSLH